MRSSPSFRVISKKILSLLEIDLSQKLGIAIEINPEVSCDLCRYLEQILDTVNRV